jgi:hypothetical protein
MIRKFCMFSMLLLSSSNLWAASADWSEEMTGEPSSAIWNNGGADYTTSPGSWIFSPGTGVSTEGLLQPLENRPAHTLDVRFRFPTVAPGPGDAFVVGLVLEQESQGTQTYGIEAGWRDTPTAIGMYTKSNGPPETPVEDHVVQNPWDGRPLWTQPFEAGRWYNFRFVSNPADNLTLFLDGEPVYEFDYLGPNGTLFTDKRLVLSTGPGAYSDVEVDYVRAYYGVLSPTEPLTAPVPEPASAVLGGLGLLALSGLRRRTRAC